MASPYTIGQLARAAGLPTSTLRYYERAGLLEPTGRSEGNYRLYGEEALERLRFIRAAQATGLNRASIPRRRVLAGAVTVRWSGSGRDAGVAGRCTG